METADRFIEVAVNSGQPARAGFTYRAPKGSDLVAGSAVFVPFGPRELHGIVLGEAEPPEDFAAREINGLADPDPILDAVHVELARWLSATYLAPLWDCLAVSLPSGYGQKHVTMIAPVDIPPLLPIHPQDNAILAHLAANGRVSIEQLRASVGPVTLPRLERLRSDGFLTVAQGLAPPAGHHKTQRWVELTIDPAAASVEAEKIKQKRPRSVESRVLALLSKQPEVPLSDVRALGASPTHLRRLAERGLIRQEARVVERDALEGRAFERRPLPELSVAQQAAADQVTEGFGEYLLHGVTGSGKTEVYQNLVGRTLAAGRDAIILVPEISLTPQAIRRYGERFGDTLAVFHSRLGAGELYDQWFRVKRGDARVIVGSRSALFVPCRNLGLVVIDEEHERSYKQENPQPRYHATAAALELCRLAEAPLVLGSATPDVVTYHRSETRQSKRLELVDRVAPDGAGTIATQLPNATVVDMRDELRAGNRGMFSYPLLHSITGALRAREQSLLFVNRRGGARFILCRDCGFMATCKTCQTGMSLDKSRSVDPRIVCHHCGRSADLEEACPSCGSGRYRPFGVGTQRVEQEARSMFPGARVLRWDSDTSRAKGAHEEFVRALESREVDIVVGTQMLAKGLDLPEMTVVGVIDADIGLNLPDYAAHERAFQLISQVGGRAGRRSRQGEVFIQTYNADNPALLCAADNDYRAFYENEISHRRRAGYPPFARLIRLVLRHKNEAAGLEEASRVASELRVRRDVRGSGDPDILGPTPAHVARLRGYFRWQILARGRNPTPLIANMRLGPGWTIDVDPSGVLT